MYARVVGVCLCALLLTACSDQVGGTLAGGSVPADQWAAALDDTRGSVLRVENQTCEGPATGTGFVLDPTTVITNAHVVAGAQSLRLTTQSGRVAHVDVAHVDTIDDLAAITTSDPLPSALRLGVDPTPGDLVRALGYPLGGVFAATEGRVVEYRDGVHYSRPGRVLVTSATVEPGNSGGPLVDSSGRVVGVVFALELQDGYTLGIPVGMLTEGNRAGWVEQPRGCQS